MGRNVHINGAKRLWGEFPMGRKVYKPTPAHSSWCRLRMQLRKRLQMRNGIEQVGRCRTVLYDGARRLLLPLRNFRRRTSDRRLRSKTRTSSRLRRHHSSRAPGWGASFRASPSAGFYCCIG